jgi:tRNA (adenine22-N1)-methyltransferase
LKKRIELRGRLKLIGDKVLPCKVVCDIGTDHAYIPIYLVSKGICNMAIATDVGEGPLNIARENIKDYGIENLIETRLGYGLEPINMGEADTIIIAGMGGKLITDIISSELPKIIKADCLILQPMNSIDLVRKYLFSEGFEIYDEELVNEGNKIYNVICTRYTGIAKDFEEIDLLVGKKLVEKADPLLEKYLRIKIRQIEVVISEMKNAKDKERDILELLNLKNTFIKIADLIKGGNK